MTDFRERILKPDEESWLKKIGRRIPGYGGYLDKEMRRDADKLLRMFIADQLQQQNKRLVEAQAELLSVPGGLDLMDDVDRVQKKLQLLIDRLRTAIYGYAGWFDSITIREDELNALYDYDATLMQGVDQVQAQVQAFVHAVAAEGDLKATLAALRQTLGEMHEQVDRRKDVLTGAVPPVPPAPPLSEQFPPLAPEEVPPVAPEQLPPEAPDLGTQG